MKNLETDKELTDLIVRTLEVHEEHYVLGSWENFEKLRTRKRRLIFWITSTGIAAAFLAGWMGFRIFYPQVNEPAVNQGKSIASTIVRSDDPAKDLTPVDAGKRNATSETHKSNGKSENIFKTAGLSQYSKEEKQMSEPDFRRKNGDIEVVNGLSFRFTRLTDASGIKNDNSAASGNSGNKVVKLNDPGNEIPYEAPAVHEKKLRFGVNVSPGVTSTSTAASYNYAGGVNADIRLAHNISLSTGLQVEHQNVVNKSTDGPAWVPQAESRAVLTALDLPVNIMWKFINRKSSSYYIASGVSSVAWLGEKYVNTTYTQKMNEVVNMVGGSPNVSYRLENVSNTSKRSETPLSTVDFAGRVNIILGYEQNMSSNLRLHVEPYLKIPLSGQAAENLKYTISGITCKISF